MPFQPGVSGNPGGVGRTPSPLKELAAGYRKEAIERLAFWMRSGIHSASTTASQAILDRSDGKPVQEIDVSPLFDIFQKMQAAYSGAQVPLSDAVEVRALPSSDPAKTDKVIDKAD